MRNRVVSNILALLIMVVLFSCGLGVKEKANQAGNAVGEVAGEFVEGAVHGASEAFEVKVSFSGALVEKGVSFGTCTVGSDSTGKDNMVTLYAMFAKDFEGNVTAKVFDAKDREIGRSNQTLKSKAQDAKYIEFHFDPHTNIDSNCKVVVE
jgi:hypothetical protein